MLLTHPPTLTTALAVWLSLALARSPGPSQAGSGPDAPATLDSARDDGRLAREASIDGTDGAARKDDATRPSGDAVAAGADGSPAGPCVTDGGRDQEFSDDRRDPGFDGRVDDPMLTDKERVRRLIAAEGGRMRQRDLVERTGWSKSRVSRLLTAMDEDGTLEKFRLGRENVVCLAEDLPDLLSGPDEGDR